MFFIILLVLITTAIAGCAAYFSVYGLAAIFSGIFWPVIIMGSALEAGKLITASYLYRYWDIISTGMKAYMLVAIFTLMLITSIGIFGFLSMGYQQDMQSTKANEQQIQLLTAEIAALSKLKKERTERKKQIDHDIASLPNNYVTGRQRLLQTYSPELRQIEKDVTEYTTTIRRISSSISKLKAANLADQVHIGPVIFIASAFSESVDNTIKWLIMIIIIVFDPLAVALTIGVNVALRERNLGADSTEPTSEITSEDQLDDIYRSSSVHSDKDSQLDEALSELHRVEQNMDTDPVHKSALEEILRKKQITSTIRTRT